jgi:hypothetical protein
MSWRSLLFLAFLQFAFGSVAQSGVVQQRAAGTPVAAALVVESGAKATLEKDAIRMVLPLSAASKPGTKVTVWLASPKNVRSGETVAILSPDGKSASAELPWPNDAQGKREEDVGWYRVGYRVEWNSVEQAHGMLSIGAIASNLMELRLAYPKLVAPGHGISARVIAVNPVTGRSLAGVRLKATLTCDEESKKKPGQTRTATSGRNGEAILSFASMGEPGDTLDLKVEGSLIGVARTGAGGAAVTGSVDGEIEVQDIGAIHIEMDKPLHKPGETVHLRAVAFRSGGHVYAGEPVTVTVSDPENKTLAKSSVRTNRFGIAAYDWKTTEQTATGDYEVKFDLDNVTGGGGDAEQEVRIQRYELPEFRATATPDRAFYLAGDEPKVKIHAEYLFGKSVAVGSVKLVRADAAEWNPKTGRYDEPKEYEDHAALDANGDATLSLKVEEEFDRLKSDSWERYRDVEYRALVTDATTGRTEPRNFAVRLTKEPVHIYLNQIGSNERDGEYILSTSFADGAPAPCRVTLDWMDDASHATRAMTERTNRYGLAKITLHFPLDAKGEPEGRPRLRITARDAQGRISHFDDELSTGSEDNIWLTVAHSVLRPGEPIEGTVHAASGTEVDLDILSENAVLGHWQTKVNGAEQPFSIPANPAFHGVITVRAYNLRGTRGERRWYGEQDGSARSVLFPEDHSLNASVKGIAPTYAPGAKVNGELLLRSAGKGPVTGAFGVSVFDTAVEQRAETEAEANDRWFGRGWWWLDQTGVGDVTLDSLNKTDTGKPIDADLDLAAEAVLMSQSTKPVAIESNDDSSVRNEYQKQMEAAVKPLGEAVLAAAPLNLPASLDELKQSAASAKLDAGILIDPWNLPYKVETGEGWHTDIVTLRSAGPDKNFGTEDDFTVTLVERNVFAIPGARLNALLWKTAQAGNHLPGTVDGLKALAREGGLDLDSAAQHTLDRKEKPYVYAIDLVRSHYFIQVQTDSGETVWQSAGVDYFEKTAEKLSSALEQWTAAGHAFPETEADALKAFAAAGIDFGALRDPLDHPFALKTKREFSYARIDKVKAGDSIQGGTEKVTLLAQVIQILRTDDKGQSYGGVDEVARFARTQSQQSGSDLKPVAVDSGLFKGNTGAIGGTVTDMTGAIVQGAEVNVEPVAGGSATSVASDAQGSFIVPDLAPGYYKIRVDARGFMSFSLTDVHVSSSALTTVDVMLRVGAATETVEVSAEQVPSLAMDSAEVSAQMRGIVKTPAGDARISEQTMTPRLRHVFEETAYWTPSLETDNAGRAHFNFILPDSMTTWKLHAAGSTLDGRLTGIDRTFKTFQPFFLDLDAPQVLTVGDEIALPVNLRNYTPRAITLPVTVKSADWFKLTTPATTLASVAPNAATPVLVGLRASSAVEAGPLRVTAANSHDGDAVEKTIKVHPDGEPRTVTSSVLLRGSDTKTIHFDLPQDAIPGSVHAELLLYPNLGANLVHAMKAVLERPYGCAEQTISSAYPSLLYLELASATKIESPEKAKAQAFLQLGYDRLLGYFSAGGGLTYWGGNDTEGDAALTAYGIEFLTDAEPYVSVDRSRIVAAVQWLLTQQSADGSWKPRYGAVSARETLLIAAALLGAIDAKDFDNSAPAGLAAHVKESVSKARAYAATSVLALHDPYSNALRLKLSARVGDRNALSRSHEELLSTAEHSKDGAHWDFDGYSPFYGWGASGRSEATALALTALETANVNTDEPLENDALLYLLMNRDEYGVWMSGQATVRVLQALLPVAIRQLQSSGTGSFALTVNGKPLEGDAADALKIDSRLLDAPRSVDLSTLLRAGTNILEFSGGSEATVANAQMTAWLYVPWTKEASGKTKATVPGKDFGLDFGYTCNVANAVAGQPIDCTVSARRFGSQSYGMLLAEVGLPPGADVDRASLGKLLDNWTISRYELEPDRIVFYLWSGGAAGEKFNFRFTPRFAIRAKAAPAKLVDYYNPDLNAVLAPQSFVVSTIK